MNPEKNEALERAQRERMDLALAYAQLLGTRDSMRSKAQRVVMADLRDRCCADKSICLATATKEGAFDPLRMAHADGGRVIWLNILQQLKTAASEPKTKKQKVIRTGDKTK